MQRGINVEKGGLVVRGGVKMTAGNRLKTGTSAGGGKNIAVWHREGKVFTSQGWRRQNGAD